jgi:hypothetical protein
VRADWYDWYFLQVRIGPILPFGLPDAKRNSGGGEASPSSVVSEPSGGGLVGPASGGSAGPRHVRSHDYFEVRLEDECARAPAQGISFAVLRLRFTNPQARAVEDAFARLLRSVDLVARSAADEYEILLRDTPAAVAEAIERSLCDYVASQRAGEPKTGLACWPRDGRSAEALLAAAGVRTHGGLAEPSAVAPSARPIVVHPIPAALAPTLPSFRLPQEVSAPPSQEPVLPASKRLPSPGAYAYSESTPENGEDQPTDVRRKLREE